MNHEPECPWRFEDDCHVVAAGVTFCEVIRAAYRRGREDADRWCNVADIAYRKGREDAAKAVLNRLLPGPTPNEWDAGFNVAIYEAAAAARGDGEQNA